MARPTNTIMAKDAGHTTKIPTNKMPTAAAKLRAMTKGSARSLRTAMHIVESYRGGPTITLSLFLDLLANRSGVIFFCAC